MTRLAPSPTGALHLGNARTFLINWAMARQAGWTLCMRIDDLDGPRVKPGADKQALDLLDWLGIDFDGEIMRQSDDLEPYRTAMHTLSHRGLIFPCDLTRRDIEQASSAPHSDDHELRFPVELRPAKMAADAFDREDTNYRLIVEEEAILVRDEFADSQEFHPSREVGDFVIWTKRCAPAYQLAVVVDDARQGVTDVVRGEDLHPSAARQMLICRALDLEPPRWWHLPLVVGTDGRRLAKRHGDTRLTSYRESGVNAERIIGLLASWCGVCNKPVPMTARDFMEGFRIDRLDSLPVVFEDSHHQWLLDLSC